jgi:hypothetical protein
MSDIVTILSVVLGYHSFLILAKLSQFLKVVKLIKFLDVRYGVMLEAFLANLGEYEVPIQSQKQAYMA